MSTDSRALIAPKACTRCSTQKRRCDRAIPNCGLCTRLRQTCRYKRPRGASSAPAPSPSPKPDVSLGSKAFTISHLKDAIEDKLTPLTPEDIFSLYYRTIEPWFPVVSIFKLGNRLPHTWDKAPFDVALLCLSIVLLTTTPPLSPEDEIDPSKFKSLYLCTKNHVTSAEGLGINSFLIVQSRVLVTLFEVAHGLYPAAYISIGATVRAADALEAQIGTDVLHHHVFDTKPTQEDTLLTWCGILVLDRYISIESGPHPSLTRSKQLLLHDLLKPIVCPTYQQGQDPSSPICRLARLFEASSLLDKNHEILNRHIVENPFNVDELIISIEAINNLQALLKAEIGDGVHLYSGGLSLCNIALLLAFENGSNVPLIAGLTDDCKYMATKSLAAVLSAVTIAAEPFALDMQSIDFNLLSPFITFLLYKTAVIITRGLLLDNRSNEEMRKLKILRNFMKIVADRWLGCERYLKLLDEDTTPRILKAVD